MSFKEFSTAQVAPSKDQPGNAPKNAPATAKPAAQPGKPTPQAAPAPKV